MKTEKVIVLDFDVNWKINFLKIKKSYMKF